MGKRGKSTHHKERDVKGKTVPSLTDAEQPYYTSASSTDDTSSERTKRRRRKTPSSRIARKNDERLLTSSEDNEILRMLKLLNMKVDEQSKQYTANKDDISELREELQELIKNKDDISEIRKQLEKVLENQNVQSKELEKLHKQLELHTNDTRHASDDPRSQPNQLQPPRYRLRLKFTSGNSKQIKKDQPMDISVTLVEGNDKTVETGSLAFAKVELVVVTKDFNKNNNINHWSREEFERSIKQSRRHESGPKDVVNQPGKSIVSNSQFNLVRGVGRHIDSTIFENSCNAKVRLGVMVVSPTEERVLEGLSNSFIVRGHDRPERQNNLHPNSSKGQKEALVDNNDYQEQNSSMPNLLHPSRINSTQTVGNRLDIIGGQSQVPFPGTNMLSTEPSTSASIPRYPNPDLMRAPEAICRQNGFNTFVEEALVDNDYQEQNSSMPNPPHPSWINSTQTAGNRLDIIGGQSQVPFPGTNMLSSELSTSASIPRYPNPDLLRVFEAIGRQNDPDLTMRVLEALRTQNEEALVDNDYQKQNSSMPNQPHPSWINSIQTAGNRSDIIGGQSQVPFPGTNMLSTEPSRSASIPRYPNPDLMRAPEAICRQNEQALADNDYQVQNSSLPHLAHPSWINSTQTPGNRLDMIGGQSQVPFPGTNMLSTEPSTSFSQLQGLTPPYPNSDDLMRAVAQAICRKNDTRFNTNPTTLAVQLVWNRPNMELRKCHWNLLDQLVPLTNFYNCGLPTTRLMQEHLDPLTIISKEVMQTRRKKGVIIEPLEPDDSDEERQLKRKMCSKYRLQFVNKVCEAYHTRDPIKADDGSLLKVALFDEDRKITYGSLSSASVQIVALHGDFNDHGQYYWTSEEFSCYEVCPRPGEEASSVLGGNCTLVLADGEACLGDAFFQMTSYCARTGKFKMGARLASAQEERIQEGVSEPFRVKDRHFAGESGRVTGPEDDTARINHPLVVQATRADLMTGSLLYTLKRKASCYQYKVTDGMEKLCNILECCLPAIMNIIQDAENKGAFDDRVAAWLKCLKTVAYEVNDIFDECTYEALRREAKKKGHHNNLGTKIGRLLVPAHNPILCRYRMGKKLRRIVQTIEELVTAMNAFGFTHLKQAPPSWQWQQTDSKTIDSDKDIVSRSRDMEKKKIVGMLLDEASNMDLMVLPITGLAGLGKTTLVQLIYNDPAIEKHFVLRRWCCVLDDFDVGTIASNICQTSDKAHENALQELKSIISGKRYLIVLDDVRKRDEAKLEKLMSCLKQGGKGSAVLTTTRDAQVAQIMKLGVAEAYTIEKLSPKHLKEIVQSIAFKLQRPDIEELDDIVDMIVDRCAGSPLAAKALGSVLSTKTSLKEWKDILAKSISCSEETGILQTLKLSYEDLQPHMKQCFAFCAVFPKDYKIYKESLVQLWIANDFIPVQGGDLPETAGEKVFEELTRRSFFEEVKKTSPVEHGKSTQLRNGTVFMMHDLIHDLARHVTREECVTIVDKPGMKRWWSNPTRYLFLSRCVSDDFSWKQFPALRTLFCTDTSLRAPHIPQLKKHGVGLLPLQSPSHLRHISKYNSLRALHLSQLEQGISLSHLRCLKYLNLSRNLELKELPKDIGMLYNLQTLDLSHCQHICHLPKSMKHMSSLRHLYTTGCISLKCMPPGLGQITSLQTLTYFVVDAGLDCSTIRELQNLNLGGELELNCLENATEALAKAANLENKEKLTHLSLKWNSSEGQEEPVQDCPKKVLCALRPHAGLHMLRIVNFRGNSLPSWTTDPSQLQHLTELHLLGCVSCEEFPPFCQLKVLQILYLEKLDKLQSLSNHVPSTPFPELRELTLHDLKSLEKVAEEGKEELTFPVLEELRIMNCPKLTCLRVPKIKYIEMDKGRPLLFSATV